MPRLDRALAEILAADRVGTNYVSAEGRRPAQLGGARRPASFELNAAADGRVRRTLRVTQSEWGINPIGRIMGALKVRDTMESFSTRLRYRNGDTTCPQPSFRHGRSARAPVLRH